MLVLVATFLSLGWWQIGRARGGNTLSFGYALEWPLFALFVIFVWYREIRSELRDGMAGRGASAPASGPVDTDQTGPVPAPPGLLRTVPTRPADPGHEPEAEDPALAEYNRYLAWLAENPDRRPAGYRRSDPYVPR